VSADKEAFVSALLLLFSAPDPQRTTCLVAEKSCVTQEFAYRRTKGPKEDGPGIPKRVEAVVSDAPVDLRANLSSLGTEVSIPSLAFAVTRPRGFGGVPRNDRKAGEVRARPTRPLKEKK
jgi:hypothetical protein